MCQTHKYYQQIIKRNENNDEWTRKSENKAIQWGYLGEC